MHVFPSGGEGEGHEDGFDSCAGSAETELRPSIEDKIEFDVASPSELLPIFLLLGIRQILQSVSSRRGHHLPFLDNGHVAREERITCILDERKHFVLISVI